MGRRRPRHAPSRDAGVKVRRTVLIAGASGNLGQMLTRVLARDWRVIGVDRRPFLGKPREVELHALDLRKRGCEALFQREPIDAVVHLGILSDRRLSPAAQRSFNMVGTTNLLGLSAKYGVAKVALLSSATVYGPLPDNSNFLDEDSPLLGATRFAGMRDLIGIDMFAQSFFYKYPSIETVILRPVHVVGPTIRNAVTSYLKLRHPWRLMGFDPMIQLIHAEDLCRAVAMALRPGVKGVYNIVGPGELPLTAALRELGRTPTPVPHLMARSLLKRLHRLKVVPFAPESLDHLQFLCNVDGTRAKRDWGWEPRFGLAETLRSVVGGSEVEPA